MKKLIPCLLALLLLTGCGAPAAAPEPETKLDADPVTEETQKTEETPPTETTGTTEPGTPDGSESSAPTKTEVTLDGLDSYLRMTLPEGWTWTEGKRSEGRTSILLTAPTDDGFQVEVVRWDSFGICGTGVEFRELELADGRKATLATEGMADMVWWTLILPAQPDQFTLQLNAPQSRIDQHQAEIDEMLDSLRIGVLAHPQTAEVPQSAS